MERFYAAFLLPLLCSCGGGISNPLDFTYEVKEGDSAAIKWNGSAISVSAGDILTVKENQVSLETPFKEVTSTVFTPVLTGISTQTYTGSSGEVYQFNCFYIKKEVSEKTGKSKRTFTGTVSVYLAERTVYKEVYTDVHTESWHDDSTYASLKKTYGESESTTAFFRGNFKALITQEEYERYSKEGGAVTFTPYWYASWGDYSIVEERERTYYLISVVVSQE